MQPDVVPSPEGVRRVAMMASKFLRQVRSLELHLRIGDACHAKIFNEDVGSENNEPAQTFIVRPGVDDGDRCSVAMANQNWIRDFEFREKFRKNG